jgi:hypothetical protein
MISTNWDGSIQFGSYAWIELERTDNLSLWLTRSIIDWRGFDTYTNDWNRSSIREYLNDDFLHSFTELESAAIELVTLDKVFLLSHDEVARYFPSLKEKIAFYDGRPKTWWLRSVGSHWPYTVEVVHDNGFFGEIDPRDDGLRADGMRTFGVTGQKGVRPALWINLDKLPL